MEGVCCFGGQQTVTAHLVWERLTAGTPHRGECCSQLIYNEEMELPEQREKTQSTVGGLDNSFYSTST